MLLSRRLAYPIAALLLSMTGAALTQERHHSRTVAPGATSSLSQSLATEPAAKASVSVAPAFSFPNGAQVSAAPSTEEAPGAVVWPIPLALRAGLSIAAILVIAILAFGPLWAQARRGSDT